MIEISDADYHSLVKARNAFGEALRELAEVADPFVCKGDVTMPEHLREDKKVNLAAALLSARTLLAKHGEHRAFVLV